jgi:hypothetical protein
MEMEGDPKWWRMLHGRRGDLYRSPERDLPPYRAIAVGGRSPRLKPGLSFLGPSGRRISHLSHCASVFPYSPFSVFQSTQFELFFYFRECVDRSL